MHPRKYAGVALRMDDLCFIGKDKIIKKGQRLELQGGAQCHMCTDIVALLTYSVESNEHKKSL